jgi:hypothetical protein
MTDLSPPERERLREMAPSGFNSFRKRYPSFPDNFTYFAQVIEYTRLINEEMGSSIDNLDHFVYIVGTEYRKHLLNGDGEEKQSPYEFWRQEVLSNPPRVYKRSFISENVMSLYAELDLAPGLADFIAEERRIESLALQQPQSSKRLNARENGASWDLNREIPSDIPERLQLDMLRKLGLCLDRTSLPQYPPTTEITCIMDKKNVAALIALEDWRNFIEGIECNPVIEEVDRTLLKLAIDGDLDGFWTLCHSFMHCLVVGW